MKKVFSFGALFLLFIGSVFLVNSYMEYKSELNNSCSELEGYVQSIKFSNTDDIDLLQRFAKSISNNATLGVSGVTVLSPDEVMSDFIERYPERERDISLFYSHPDRIGHEVRFVIDDIRNFDETEFYSEIVKLSNVLNVTLRSDSLTVFRIKSRRLKASVEECYNMSYFDYQTFKDMSDSKE